MAVRGKTWLTTGKNRDNPQPLLYPQCAVCATPWVYKRFLSLRTGGYVWAWGRDCKHKESPTTIDEREESAS